MTTTETIVPVPAEKKKTTVLDNWKWQLINALVAGLCLVLSTGSLFGLWGTGFFPLVNYLLAAMALIPLADYIAHKMELGLGGAVMAVIMIYVFLGGLILTALKFFLP